MNTPDDPALAADIEAAVRAAPGVAALYRSGSLVSNAIDTGARLLGLREDESLVRLVRDTEGLRIELSIGVLGAESSAVTALRTHEVIEALLASRHVTDTEIRVTVVHVGDATLG